jgi:hypothetical protein
MLKKLREWAEDNLIPLLLTALSAVVLLYLLHKFYFY